MPHPQSLFVTGTDTGVGKTMVTALLALKLRSLGVDAGVMKPFASGCEVTECGLVSEDATFLRDTVGLQDDLDLINPIRLEAPLAPLMAARLAGVSTAGWKDAVREAYAELSRRHDCVLVEGVGGLLVPVGESDSGVWNCLDLIAEWHLPVIVVARRTLGTVNHTLLTVGTRLPKGSSYLGFVFCDAEPVGEDDVAVEKSPGMIVELSGLPAIGQVPFIEGFSLAKLEETARVLQVP